MKTPDNSGQLTKQQMADALGISSATFLLWAKRLNIEGKRSSIGWRYWTVNDIPEIIKAIVPVITSRKYEKRDADQIRVSLYAAWMRYLARFPELRLHVTNGHGSAAEILLTNSAHTSVDTVEVGGNTAADSFVPADE